MFERFVKRKRSLRSQSVARKRFSQCITKPKWIIHQNVSMQFMRILDPMAKQFVCPRETSPQYLQQWPGSAQRDFGAQHFAVCDQRSRSIFDLHDHFDVQQHEQRRFAGERNLCFGRQLAEFTIELVEQRFGFESID